MFLWNIWVRRRIKIISFFLSFIGMYHFTSILRFYVISSTMCKTSRQCVIHPQICYFQLHKYDPSSGKMSIVIISGKAHSDINGHFKWYSVHVVWIYGQFRNKGQQQLVLNGIFFCQREFWSEAKTSVTLHFSLLLFWMSKTTECRSVPID